MKIYAISGLGADARVYNPLKKFLNIHALEWIDPNPQESIESYAKRLAEPINTAEEFCLMGVSLGGLMLCEMNKFLQPKTNFLLSSVAHYKELRGIYRVLGILHADKLVPLALFNPPNSFVAPFLGLKDTALIKDFAAMENTRRSKWFVQQLIRWRNTDIPSPLVRIHGTKDLLMPFRNIPETHVIQGGTHVIVIEEAEQIAQIIKQELRKLD
jgi:pimeloyl-ACP methyl ester carboxylesterase